MDALDKLKTLKNIGDRVVLNNSELKEYFSKGALDIFGYQILSLFMGSDYFQTNKWYRENNYTIIKNQSEETETVQESEWIALKESGTSRLRTFEYVLARFKELNSFCILHSVKPENIYVKEIIIESFDLQDRQEYQFEIEFTKMIS